MLTPWAKIAKLKRLVNMQAEYMDYNRLPLQKAVEMDALAREVGLQ